jgi:hypothetical protein
MPWGYSDAKRHTKKATTPAAEKQWSAVANSVLSDSGDEGKAVRIANGVVKKRHVVPRRKKR